MVELFGIDKPIEKIRADLESNLLEWGNIKIYGRCYKNLNSEGRYEPKVYKGNNEYEEPFLNDRNLIAYFIDSDNHRTENDIMFTTEVRLVFVADLSKLFQDRKDSYMHSFIRNLLNRNSRNFFRIDSLEKGYRNVMSGFDLERYKHLDMQPYHIFSFTGTMDYYLNINC